MPTKEKTDIAISLVVVLIALGFILYHTTFKQGDFLQAENKESLEAPELIELDGKDYRLSAINQTEQNPEVESSTTKSDSHSSETDLESIDTLVDKEHNGYPSNVDTSQQIEKIEEPEIDTSSNFTEQSEIETNLPEKNSEILEKNCIILVGSFSKRANADKVKKRLQAEAYEIFETSFNNLHRIGVYINCDSDVQYKELQHLKKNYAVDARLYIEE